MEEVFLYGCESCDTTKYSKTNNSQVWCTMCQVCRSCEFHQRIKVQGHRFMTEEKKDDSKKEE